MGYHSALNKNELSSCEKTWKKLKCVGVQDTLPPKYGAPWDVEYFKLKELEKTAETGRSL